LDVGAHAGELLLVLGTVDAGLFGGLGECVVDELPVAVDGGELGEYGVLQAFLGQSLSLAAGAAVLVASGAGVVGVAGVAAVGGGADVGASAVLAAHEPGEQEGRGVAAPQRGVLEASGEDLLGLLEGVLLDQWLVLAFVELAAPADQAEVGGVCEDLPAERLVTSHAVAVAGRGL
jgi:hypothetical protein